MGVSVLRLDLRFIQKSSKGTGLRRPKLHPDTVSVPRCCVSVGSHIKSLPLHYFLLVSLLQTKLRAIELYFFLTPESLENLITKLSEQRKFRIFAFTC